MVELRGQLAELSSFLSISNSNSMPQKTGKIALRMSYKLAPGKLMSFNTVLILRAVHEAVFIMPLDPGS